MSAGSAERSSIAGSWRLADGWGVIDRPEESEHGGRLYAAPLATGPVSVLEGPSAVVARAALVGSDLTAIRDCLVETLDVAHGSVDDAAVAELLGELVGLGMLHHAHP